MNPTDPHLIRLDGDDVRDGSPDSCHSVVMLKKPSGEIKAVLANISSHYAGHNPRTHISADFFGVWAGALKKALLHQGVCTSSIFMLTYGAGGDVNTRDYTKMAPPENSYDYMNTFGTALAQKTLQAILRQEVFSSWIYMGIRTMTITFKARKLTHREIVNAQNVCSSKIKNHHHLAKIFLEKSLRWNKDCPSHFTYTLAVVRLGDLGIVITGAELFSGIIHGIRTLSPFPHTITHGLVNGVWGYIPEKKSFRKGGYATWPCEFSCLEIGAAERIMDTSLKLLNRLVAQ